MKNVDLLLIEQKNDDFSNHVVNIIKRSHNGFFFIVVESRSYQIDDVGEC